MTLAALAYDDDEMQLAADLSHFYADPLGFVMYAFPWSSDPSLKVVELPEPWASKFNCKYGPDRWACEFLEDLSGLVRARRFNGVDAVDPIRMAVASGHGIGKSAMTGWLVCWILSTRPNAQGTVTANTFTQLETKTWAQIRKWMKMCVTSHWFHVGASKIVHKEFPEKWFCSAQTSREENSESFAGQHAVDSTSFYIDDEASAISDKIQEVQDGGMTDGEPMHFKFGNPTRNTGVFRECWRRLRHRWQTFKVDSRSVQITNKQFLQDMIDDYGIDSDRVKVRVLGDFPQQSLKQFIGQKDIDAAAGRHLKPTQFSFAPVIIGVDPAWTGDDDFVIVKRQGLQSEVLGVYERNDDDVHMATIIANFEIEHKAKAIFVDGGFGTGIVSAGRAMNRNWQIVWFSESSPDAGFLNMRAYMWGELKKWLKSGAAIPDDDVLTTDLAGPETVARLDGKIQLESKEDMRKRDLPSPNHADALALTFARPVLADIDVPAGFGKIIHDFNPYGEGDD